MKALAENQEEQRRKLYGLLGELPASDYPLSATLVEREESDNYVLEKLVLELNGIESVPAYFTKPTKATQPLPCVLYNHAHGGDYQLGKDELLCGRKALQNPPYAAALSASGYAALCIDSWNFGERRGRTEHDLFARMLWQGQVLWGMMVYDSVRARDYLVSREDVDETRIATLGISMGSTMAWWTAALDTRIKVCVDLCCLTDFQALIDSQGLGGHGIYYYVPALLKHFTAAQINALIAPRPHLSLAGSYDRLTPMSGLERINAELKQVYQDLDADAAWELKCYEIGHFETAAMRAEVLSFLRQWL